MPDTPEKYLRDATGSFGGSEFWGKETLGDRNAFQSYQYILAYNATVVVNSENDLPVDAHIRPNGVFSDVEDMIEYLERGGLVVNDPTSPYRYRSVGFVYCIVTYKDDGSQEFQVYIRDDSD